MMRDREGGGGGGGGMRPCACSGTVCVLLYMLLVCTNLTAVYAAPETNVTVAPPAFLYQCKSGDYVNVLYTCDGVADCGDSSDEHDCGRVEARDRMRCRTPGYTTSVWNSCDGWQDCPDAADEEHCGKSNSCNRGVPCKSYHDIQRCIQPDRCILNNTVAGLPKVGNVTEDVNNVLTQIQCMDFSINAPRRLCDKCGTGKYHCRGSNTCIPLSSLCDRSRDCLRGDDEKFCNELISPQCRGGVKIIAGKRITEMKCTDTLTKKSQTFIGDLWMNKRIIDMDGLPAEAFTVTNLKSNQYNGRYVAVLSLQNTGLQVVPAILVRYLAALRKLYLQGTVLWDIRGVITMLRRPALQYMDIEKAIGDEFPFTQVWVGSLQRSNTSVKQRIDIYLKYDDCCQLLALVESNCDSLHSNINTCSDLLPRNTLNILWILIGVGSALNLIYIITQSKYRKEDELKFMGLVTIFIANLLTLLSLLGLSFKIENTGGEYHLHDKAWRQSYSCWILSSITSLSYLLYSTALVIMILQVVTRRCCTVDRYFKIVSSRSFVCYMLIVVMIPLIPVFLPLSHASSLKSYINNFSPICSPFYDLVNVNMPAGGKQYSIVIFVGTPALLLCINTIGLVLYLKNVWKKREQPMLDPEQQQPTPWSSIVCMITGQVYGITVAVVGMMIYTRALVIPERLAVNVSLFMVPSFILFSPLSFLITPFRESKILRNCSDQILNNRKSTLRRMGGFNRRASRAYQKLSVYLEANGKVTPGEALLMARKMAFMIKHFHEEGMVCDDISTDFVVIGVDPKQRVLDYDLIVTTEYPKCDVHEWRRQRDVALFGEVVKALVDGIQAAKQKRMMSKKVSFKMQLSNTLSNQLSKRSKADKKKNEDKVEEDKKNNAEKA